MQSLQINRLLSSLPTDDSVEALVDAGVELSNIMTSATRALDIIKSKLRDRSGPGNNTFYGSNGLSAATVSPVKNQPYVISAVDPVELHKVLGDDLGLVFKVQYNISASSYESVSELPKEKRDYINKIVGHRDMKSRVQFINGNGLEKL